jgi:hypothetical protein
MLTGIQPILIELEYLTQLYHITRRNKLNGLYDAPKGFREWPHPAAAIEPKNYRNDINYTTDIYTEGSKNDKGVGAGIAIFIDGNLTFQLRYNLAEKCSKKTGGTTSNSESTRESDGLASSTEKPTKSSHTYR